MSESSLNYDVIALACEQLSYRDKLRLAQLLIQMARKEEEEANPRQRSEIQATQKIKTNPKDVKDADTVKYVIERLGKLKPSTQKALTNAIKSMFQFQGGISDADIEKIIVELKKRKYLKIDKNTVTYLL